MNLAQRQTAPVVHHSNFVAGMTAVGQEPPYSATAEMSAIILNGSSAVVSPREVTEWQRSPACYPAPTA